MSKENENQPRVNICVFWPVNLNSYAMLCQLTQAMVGLMNDLRKISSDLLCIDPADAGDLIELRTGARTVGLLATPPGMDHAFTHITDQVLIKFYKGDWSTKGGQAYQTYHSDHFHRIPALDENPFIQKSITANVYRHSGTVQPYAVLEYKPGRELSDVLESGALSAQEAIDIMRGIFENIWIPLWSAGLRFKDCHPGNFIVKRDGSVHMIDTEQMRKDAEELLIDPSQWIKRIKHETQGISRLPGLISRIFFSVRPDLKKGSITRTVKTLLAETQLTDALGMLNRTGNTEVCLSNSNTFMLKSLELLSKQQPD